MLFNPPREQFESGFQLLLGFGLIPALRCWCQKSWQLRMWQSGLALDMRQQCNTYM